MDKIKVGIAGAAGYTGCELIRLLATHPRAEISWLMTGKTNEGKSLHEVFPHLRGVPERVFQPLEPASAEETDLVFMATPHGVAVYEVQPGIVLTEMTQPSKAKYDALIAAGLLVEPRWGTPGDVARTVRSMAAGLLPYTVGQEVRVDGGLLLRRF